MLTQSEHQLLERIAKAGERQADAAEKQAEAAERTCELLSKVVLEYSGGIQVIVGREKDWKDKSP